MTGRHTAFGDGYIQADGTIAVPGTAIDEVGTWDAAGTDFTPSAGI